MYLAIYEYEHKVAFACHLSVQQSPAGTFAAARTDVTQRGLQFEFITWTNLPAKTSAIETTKERKF
jgi:hypothetical protein